MVVENSARNHKLQPPCPTVYIATLLREDGETGVQTHIRSFIAAATRLGVTVRLLSPFGLPTVLVYLALGPGRLFRRVSQPIWVWWYNTSRARLLRHSFRRHISPDTEAIIYAQDPFSARLALQLRERGYRVRVILIVHFNVSQAGEWAEKGAIRADSRTYAQIAAVESEVMPKLDGLIFPSEFMMRSVLERHPDAVYVPRECIPNFVYPPPQEDIGQRSGDLITIGTLEPRKNHEFLLRTVAACHRIGYPYRLTIAGDGPLRSALEALAVELGIAGSVVFLGYVPNAGRLLHGHRAYVHAARVENLPLVLLEALATGRPVFAAPVGGVPEVFSDGLEGRYWDLYDPSAAARRLIEVLQDSSRYQAMADAARKRYDARFSADRVVPRLLQALTGGSCQQEGMPPLAREDNAVETAGR